MTANETPAAARAEDKRLERLYDYTKFHIGIYLSAAGGLIALISAASAHDSTLQAFFCKANFRHPQLLGVAFLLLVLAGGAGAVVATSAIECATYDDFKDRKHGGFGLHLLTGGWWTAIEHGAFWLSLFCLALSIFSTESVRNWVIVPTPFALVTGLIVLFVLGLAVWAVQDDPRAGGRAPAENCQPSDNTGSSGSPE